MQQTCISYKISYKHVIQLEFPTKRMGSIYGTESQLSWAIS